MQKYYNILELDRDCSLNELKLAFRKKAKQFHPDLNDSPEAHIKFIEINEAYIILNKIKSGIEDYTEKGTEIYRYYNEEKVKAKQRAAYYAKMNYEEYKNSPIYKASRVLNPIFKTAVIAFGIFIFAAPFIFITYRIIYHLKIPSENFAYLLGAIILVFLFARIVYKEIKYS